MKRALILFFVLALFCSCDRYPTHLQPADQVQALIFQHMAAQLFESGSGGDEALRLFLCYGAPQGDPSQDVLAYVGRSFRSTRPCSAVAPRKFGPVTERGTGRNGIELRMEPFSISRDGPLTVRVSYFVKGGHAEGFEYLMQRVKGRWMIVARNQLWIA